MHVHKRRKVICLHTFVMGLALVGAGAMVEAEDLPPVVGGGAVTLHDIAGTSTLVTVVLKGTGAEEKNLRVADVYDNHFSVLSQDNSLGAYVFSSVQEVRVQGGKVETKRFKLDDIRSLRAEEQKVVERAYARAREIFNTANDDQSIKMRAATLLALNRDAEAHEYLRQLAASNDLMTALQALSCLYLVGDTIQDTSLLKRGLLESGNRKVKAQAAALSGLLGDHSNESYLTTMLQDRLADYSKPAALALARLGNRDCIPTLLRMITELSEEKGEAAIFALSRLGGEDVAEQMRLKYAAATGEMQFRIARVLHNIGDPSGRALLSSDMMPIPTLTEQVALILGRDGDVTAMHFLRGRLNRRFDEIEKRLIYRADAAAALIAGGDFGPTAVLQELLRSETTAVAVHVCDLVAELGKRQLLTLLQPPIENAKSEVALAACAASVAIADPDHFRERLLEWRM